MMTSVADIQELQRRRQRRSDETFEHITGQLLNRIHRTVINAPDVTFSLLSVPEFVLGRPQYRLNDAVTYVLARLKACGFTTQYFFPNVILASWDATAPRAAAPVASAVRSLSELKPSGRFVLQLPPDARPAAAPAPSSR
jgi:hypothetical protein